MAAAGSVLCRGGSLGLEPFSGEHLMRSWELLEKCLRISVRQREFTLWVVKLSPWDSQTRLMSPLFMAHPKLPSINLPAGGGGSDSVFPVSELLALVSPPVVTPTLKTFGCDIYTDSTFRTSLASPPQQSAGWEVGCDILGSPGKHSELLGNPLTRFLLVATSTEPSVCVAGDRLLDMSLLHPYLGSIQALSLQQEPEVIPDLLTAILDKITLFLTFLLPALNYQRKEQEILLPTVQSKSSLPSHQQNEAARFLKWHRVWRAKNWISWHWSEFFVHLGIEPRFSASQPSSLSSFHHSASVISHTSAPSSPKRIIYLWGRVFSWSPNYDGNKAPLYFHGSVSLCN